MLKQENVNILFFLPKKVVNLDLFSQLNLFSENFTHICSAFDLIFFKLKKFNLEVSLKNTNNGCVMVEM